jgi:hypothetical protein
MAVSVVCARIQVVDAGGKIVEINSIVDPERLRRLDFSVLGP